MAQPITLCTSTFKKDALLQPIKGREKPMKGRVRYIDLGVIVCRYMHKIHAAR